MLAGGGGFSVGREPECRNHESEVNILVVALGIGACYFGERGGRGRLGAGGLYCAIQAPGCW